MTRSGWPVRWTIRRTRDGWSVRCRYAGLHVTGASMGDVLARVDDEGERLDPLGSSCMSLVAYAMREATNAYPRRNAYGGSVAP